MAIPITTETLSKARLLYFRRPLPRFFLIVLPVVTISLIFYGTSPTKFLQRLNAVSEQRDEQVSILSSGIAQQTPSKPTLPQPRSTPPRPPRPERIVRAPFYLKLHKTGSSTIAHHLLGFTRSHKLRTLQAPAQYMVATPNPTPLKYDAIVAHHVVFNNTVIKSYMNQPPDLLLTSVRLPLQRQVSWFQQQNKNLGDISCEPRNDTLLAHFDAWYPKRLAAQIAQMKEAGSKEALNDDIQKILDQFDFVFIKERMRESFECFCEETGIRLCSAQMPLVKKNVRGGTCVEQQLLKYRAAQLLNGNERDLLLYEAAGRRLNCRPSEWCLCPEGAAR